MTDRRDRKGHFIKGHVPWNKRPDNTEREITFPGRFCSDEGYQTRTIQQKVNKQCVHHWMIDRFDVGTCKKCGEVRDFKKLRGEIRQVASRRQ